MRIMLSMAVLSMTVSLFAAAEESQYSSRPSPTGAEIIDVDGCRLARVFGKCGYPASIFPSTDRKKNPTVCLEYDGYMFEIRQKGVIGCYVYAPFAGEVLGCKVGDSTDEVLKKLGRPRLEGKEKDGKQTMIWDFKDQDQDLQISFQDKKCKSFIVSLKN